VRRRYWAAPATVVVALAVLAVVLLGRASPRRPRSHPRGTPPVLPALAAPAGQAFGINVNRLFDDRTYSPEQIGAQLTALEATGATVARSDTLWEATEPTAPSGGNHHWVWQFDDSIVAALAAHGLTCLPILDYSAPWAQSVPGQDHSPPPPVADYAAFAAAFAARYGDSGTFWRVHPELTARPVTTIEVWNEPDNAEFWVPAPDAASYAHLYLATRSAIDAVDPAARVIVGGLVDPTKFLPAMVHAAPQLVGHVDGVAVHPYGTPSVVVAKLRDARATLAALGMGSVPLYVTEFGWTTSPAGSLGYVAPARRPAWIQRTIETLGHLGCGLAASVLYTWVTPQSNAGDSQDWFGIENPNATVTAASRAFATGLHAAAAPGKRIPCNR
jgi:polysaccharide biosynthesis protein PslG